MQIQISGISDVIARLEGSHQSKRARLTGAISAEARRILAASQPLVPVDTGALKASGRVDQPDIGAGRIEVTIRYGGPGVDYAIYVHEDLSAHHNVGQAKFLERPALAAVNGMVGRIAADLRGGP